MSGTCRISCAKSLSRYVHDDPLELLVQDLCLRISASGSVCQEPVGSLVQDLSRYVHDDPLELLVQDLCLRISA